MPVPKKRHSNIRQGKRRYSNYKLEGVNLGKCPQCGGAVLPHFACKNCGTFQGRPAIKLKTKKKKKGSKE